MIARSDENHRPRRSTPVLGKELYSAKYLLSRKKSHCISISQNPRRSRDNRLIAVTDSSIADCSARPGGIFRNPRGDRCEFNHAETLDRETRSKFAEPS